MSKRKEADAAYQRQEDQRALTLVLAAATDFSIEMKEWAGAVEIDALDKAIDRVKASFLKVEVPKPEPAIPGQLAIDGSVAGGPVAPVRELGAPMAAAYDVPPLCPKCGSAMLTQWGGSWTPLVAGGPGYALQCGHCAHVIPVSERQYEAVVAERKRTIGASDRPAKIIARERRTRGAG